MGSTFWRPRPRPRPAGSHGGGWPPRADRSMTVSPGPIPAFDVLVVGGGPAGSATAAFLAGAGHSVLIVDRAAFPRDKACSEYMSPEAVRILARLGVLEQLERAG